MPKHDLKTFYVHAAVRGSLSECVPEGVWRATDVRNAGEFSIAPEDSVDLFRGQFTWLPRTIRLRGRKHESVLRFFCEVSRQQFASPGSMASLALFEPFLLRTKMR